MASITPTTTGPIFQAGGLASNLDTNGIIDKLVQIESQPISNLQTQQAALNAQVSTLGDITSKLSALDSATSALGTGGALGVAVSSNNASFGATPVSTATPGRYSVQVQQLAAAAKIRSQGFGSTNSVVGGTLSLTVMGQTYDGISVADGASLSDVAYAINATGAPVSAAVLTDDTGQSYLSLTNLATGVPSSGAALSLAYTTQDPVGAGQQALAFSTITSAVDAQVLVDGLTFSRQSNTISDVIPGVTLNLTTQGGLAEDLVLSTDANATQAKLQTFVDAYNAVMGLVQKQLGVTSTTDTSRLLTGDFAIQNLGASLQQLLTTQVGSGPVRTLADLGAKINYQDGSLTIDPTVLQQALALSPQAVNTIFSDQAQGLAAVVHNLVQTETDPTNGLLTLDSQGLSQQSSGLDDQIQAMQASLDAYRQRLQAQFTAMEQLVAGFKSTSSFLTQQAALLVSNTTSTK